MDPGSLQFKDDPFFYYERGVDENTLFRAEDDIDPGATLNLLMQ